MQKSKWNYYRLNHSLSATRKTRNHEHVKASKKQTDATISAKVHENHKVPKWSLYISTDLGPTAQGHNKSVAKKIPRNERPAVPSNPG
jgi:hypothetical protein